MAEYIYHSKQWPSFSWNEQEVQALLGEVRHLQGKILGQMSTVGFSVKDEAHLNALTLDVTKSSEIEGEFLNYDQVRSSIAKKLGLEYGGITQPERDVEAVVEMMLDATGNYKMPLDEVGRYRSREMQVVSGAMGKEKVHYQAPSPDRVKKEMDRFLKWFNENKTLDLVLKSAIAHFWFIIIHPFDDGNGRIARAISDLLLSRSDNTSQRFYSLSNQILIERKVYYSVLQKTQFADGDITEWLVWYLNCLYRALQSTETTFEKVRYKSIFWEEHAETVLNARQRLMLNKLLDGFEGKLTSSKWAKITKSSQDTALRDINDLIDKGILQKEAQGGRSTNYELIQC